MTEKVFSREEIVQRLRDIVGWNYNEKEIVRNYEFDDFLQAIKFVNQVALRSQDTNHHPAILISDNAVQLSVYSHTAKGITQKDFDLALEINKLVA
ncbi:4a-hydroxytetrahydrobiopterin dehydratase [Candidatus Micrarchaeota archaeon]|nr:4a-hydroxytetrahydrobiopterin dehydratase [Candidatus Micrarchaeota archaeon]MBU1930966.1 4a-hydroxytetrahydrobiopterin dehydratase [Candidatus Micrarchaeota archaeon]